MNRDRMAQPGYLMGGKVRVTLCTSYEYSKRCKRATRTKLIRNDTEVGQDPELPDRGDDDFAVILGRKARINWDRSL